MGLQRGVGACRRDGHGVKASEAGEMSVQRKEAPKRSASSPSREQSIQLPLFHPSTATGQRMGCKCTIGTSKG